MRIDPLSTEDAPALLALAKEWGQNTFVWSPNSAGLVARDDEGVQGFALLCPRPYGTVVDELWCARTRGGILALGALIDFIEQKNPGKSVGGVVRRGTPLYAALLKRDYEPTATVLTKDIPLARAV